MADGRIVKPDKDFTKEADTQIPEAQELAKVVHDPTLLMTVLSDPPLGKRPSSHRKA
jgi:hypothetical protein